MAELIISVSYNVFDSILFSTCQHQKQYNFTVGDTIQFGREPHFLLHVKKETYLSDCSVTPRKTVISKEKYFLTSYSVISLVKNTFVSAYVQRGQ